MSLYICIKARWVFSTVAEFHYFTTFTTSPSELAKFFASTVSVESTSIPFNSAPLATRARYTELEVFAKVSPSSSEYSEVVKPSLGCKRANSYGGSTKKPWRARFFRAPYLIHITM